jgi:Arc/MetJ-type ribon-helix-helix transcriptional regulator
MRTTIRLDEHLLAETKVEAAKSGKSLSEFIGDALREVLARRRGRQQRWIELPAEGRGGLQPGVNLDSASDLLDIMEGSDAPP